MGRVVREMGATGWGVLSAMAGVFSSAIGRFKGALGVLGVMDSGSTWCGWALGGAQSGTLTSPALGRHD